MRLAPEPHPQRAQAGRLAKTLGWQDALTDNRKATLYNWEKQFELIRQGVAFVRATASSDGAEPFDVVVRMRMVRDQPNKTRPAPVAPLFACLLGDPSPRSPHAPCLPRRRTCTSLFLECFCIAQSRTAL